MSPTCNINAFQADHFVRTFTQKICAHNSFGPTLGSRWWRFSTAHITSLLMLYDSLQGAPTTRKYVRTTVFASLWEADDQLVGNVLSTSTSFLCAQPYSQAGTSVKYNPTLQEAPTSSKFVRTIVFTSLQEADDWLVSAGSISFLCAHSTQQKCAHNWCIHPLRVILGGLENIYVACWYDWTQLELLVHS